jgi:hypothetical protein
VPAGTACEQCSVGASSNFLAALVRKLESIRAALDNRAQGRAEIGIHLGQGVLNPC